MVFSNMNNDFFALADLDFVSESTFTQVCCYKQDEDANGYSFQLPIHHLTFSPNYTNMNLCYSSDVFRPAASK